MYRATYYYANGYVGLIPYPLQWIVPYQPPPPLAHPTFVSLPIIPTHLPPHGFPSGIYYPPQDEPRGARRDQTFRDGNAAAGSEGDSRPLVAPRAPTPPNPYHPRHLPDGVRPWPDRGIHNPSRFAIDPILALPEPPFGILGFEWDLADDPIRSIFGRPENAWIHRQDLARAAVRDGARALERLVLVFAGLSGECDAQIEVTHTHPATILGGVDEDMRGVTVNDVLSAIFQWVLSPMGADEMQVLEGELFAAVIWTADARRRGRNAGWPPTISSLDYDSYLKIDYLGDRRRFKGIRAALGAELPLGRIPGEVFVVELGASD